MARFHIDSKLRKNLEYFGQEKAKKLAQEARDRLSDHYLSLIDWFYSDAQPGVDKYGEPYYHRTFGLYKSFKKYYKNSHNSIYYGGVEITADKMKDYPSLNGEGFSAQRLLDKFIYVPNQPSATWHGGNWHGGYGVMAGFSVYNEMNDFHNKLLKEYQDRCSAKVR